MTSVAGRLVAGDVDWVAWVVSESRGRQRLVDSLARSLARSLSRALWFAQVEREIVAEGGTREGLGRDEFLKRAWQYKEDKVGVFGVRWGADLEASHSDKVKAPARERRRITIGSVEHPPDTCPWTRARRHRRHAQVWMLSFREKKRGWGDTRGVPAMSGVFVVASAPGPECMNR
jgi:hypothetical protein